ncbi:MAG TPA: outer membrane beta-barrel protein, partial [Ideonella sp.]|nr:outer membrane beta-barrel protein [Ideonella sp.]
APAPTPLPPGASAGEEAAQPPSPPPAAATLFQPAAWTAGSWSITPQLALAAGHNDNLRLQSSAAIASPFIALFPSLTAARPAGEGHDQLSWRSEWTRFTGSRVDSTLNTELAAEGMRLLDEQTALAWRLAWQDWHDAVGQAAPDQPVDAADHFRAMALGAVWRHDAGDAAQHRTELEPTLSRKRYQNHLEVTEQANADSASLVGRYLFTLAPSRRVGPELRVVRTRFVLTDQALSNTSWRASAMWQWDATETFNGTARLGREQRHFDRFRPPYSGTTWDADLHWLARPTTQLDFSASRAALDAPGEGADQAVSRRFALSWTQVWSPQWRATLSASHNRNQYVNAALPRQDRLRSLDLGLRCDVARNWQLGLNIGWAQRRSSISAFDFTRHLNSLVLTAAL